MRTSFEYFSRKYLLWLETVCLFQYVASDKMLDSDVFSMKNNVLMPVVERKNCLDGSVRNMRFYILLVFLSTHNDVQKLLKEGKSDDSLNLKGGSVTTWNKDKITTQILMVCDAGCILFKFSLQAPDSKLRHKGNQGNQNMTKLM